MLPNYEDVMSRFKEKMNFTHDSDVAKCFNISTAALSERKRRKAIPYEHIINACKEHGISMDFVIRGGSKLFSKAAIANSGLKKVDADTMIVFPYFKDIKAVADIANTDNESSDDNIPYIVIPHASCREISISSDHLLATIVNDDSMEGSIMDRSIVLINLEDNDYKSGKIYVVNIRGKIYLKRIFSDIKSPKTIVLKSDNVHYPEFTVDRDDIKIIGRVVYVYNQGKMI